jgi:membrane-bound lytic murein transglycosylase D
MKRYLFFRSFFLAVFSMLLVYSVECIPALRAEDSHWLAHSKKKKKVEKPKIEDNQLSEAGPRGLIHFQFPLPESLKPNVEFWKMIYSQYDKNQRVFHDTEHLQVVYSAIDFSDPTPMAGEDEEEGYIPPPSNKSRIEAEKQRIRAILLRLAAGGYEEKDLNDEEKKIYHLFDTIDEPDKFLAAASPGRIRIQTGQKDKFLKAIEWSGRYLTEIEDIFTSQHLPMELTRMIFVESMFNLKARSKAGASGIWQFIPGTGRLFLSINSVKDERNDPLQATHAAALLLQSNFDLLGSWPLAINAYHSGPQNLLNAKTALATDDIGVITSNYSGGAYKFASRNYYAEFLAALEVANHYKTYFGEIERLPAMKYEEFSLETPTRLDELSQTCQVNPETLEELNPGFHSFYFYSNRPLPAGTVLKIPPGMADRFKKGLEEIATRHAGGLTPSVAVE